MECPPVTWHTVERVRRRYVFQNITIAAVWLRPPNVALQPRRLAARIFRKTILARRLQINPARDPSGATKPSPASQASGSSNAVTAPKNGQLESRSEERRVGTGRIGGRTAA